MAVPDILEHLPPIVKRDGVLAKYIEAHEEEFDDLQTDRAAVIDSYQIDNASGSDLDKIGALFGELGRRRGRSDDDYQVYLKGIVESFNGRGTTEGLKFAIASAIGTDPSNVIIDEDFENMEYDIQVVNVNTSFLSSSINDLAELADPSAVELDQAIIITGGDDVIIDEGSSSVSSSTTGLGGNTLTLDGNSTLG